MSKWLDQNLSETIPPFCFNVSKLRGLLFIVVWTKMTYENHIQ